MKKILIDINDNNTNISGTYKVWYTKDKKKQFKLLSEDQTNALLEMNQKEDFFMGKHKFKVSLFDFENIENVKGLN